MKRLASTAIIIIAGIVGRAAPANEALDILEGRADPDEVPVPPAAADAAAEEAEIIHFDDDVWAPSPLDPIWARATLYQDPTNCWVQELAVQGMFHWSGVFGHSETEANNAAGLRRKAGVSSTRTRRARLGARMRMFYNTEIEAKVEFAGDGEYSGIDELKARVELLPGVGVSFGKIRPRWSLEYSTDPQRLLTPERSMLVDMMAPARTLGIMVDGESDRWDYGVGWFSSDADDGIPALQGSGFLLAKLGYESVDRSEGGEPIRTRWHLDYIYNFDKLAPSVPRFRVPDGARSANGGRRVYQPGFRHLLATGVSVDQGRFSFAGDFLLGNGGSSNVWGLTITPGYWAIPGTLRLVGRYHYADTDDPGGLVTGLGRDPFFDASPLYTGDEYHSFYLGGNLHLYRDQLVLMAGLEYALLKDGAGKGYETDFLLWQTAARMAF